MMSHTAARGAAAAVRRLQTDLRDLRRNPVPCVAAEPVEGDLFTWHANIVGPCFTPYEGGVFHVVILFPPSYPHDAPSVRVVTPIPHPHVIGDKICLDLLSDYQAYFEDGGDGDGRREAVGWSSAYSVSTILVQMHAFLMELDHADEDILSECLKRVPPAIRFAREFHCSECGHSGRTPWPEVNTEESAEHYHKLYEQLFYRAEKESRQEEETDSDGECESSDVAAASPRPEEEEEEEEREDSEEMALIGKLEALSRLEEEEELSEMGWQAVRESLTCFHSRQTYEEDCMGFGLTVTTKRGRYTGAGSDGSLELRASAGRSSAVISKIDCSFDVLSYTSFTVEGVRHGVMNEKLTHWLPLYINDTHGKEALKLAEQSLSLICTHQAGRFRPPMVLTILPKIMCTMVVAMMSDQLHASSKALAGYCAVHRLLLKFAELYPELVDRANSIMGQFVKNEKKRVKRIVPNLGEFLPLLTIADYTWDDIKYAYLSENLDRNVLWLLKKFPQLRRCQPGDATDRKRPEMAFEGSKIASTLYRSS